jgi:hypothetical protein
LESLMEESELTSVTLTSPPSPRHLAAVSADGAASSSASAEEADVRDPSADSSANAASAVADSSASSPSPPSSSADAAVAATAAAAVSALPTPTVALLPVPVAQLQDMSAFGMADLQRLPLDVNFSIADARAVAAGCHNHFTLSIEVREDNSYQLFVDSAHMTLEECEVERARRKDKGTFGGP